MATEPIIQEYCPICEKPLVIIITPDRSLFRCNILRTATCRTCLAKGLKYISGHGGPPELFDSLNNRRYLVEKLFQPLLINFPDYNTRPDPSQM